MIGDLALGHARPDGGHGRAQGVLADPDRAPQGGHFRRGLAQAQRGQRLGGVLQDDPRRVALEELHLDEAQGQAFHAQALSGQSGGGQPGREGVLGAIGVVVGKGPERVGRLGELLNLQQRQDHDRVALTREDRQGGALHQVEVLAGHVDQAAAGHQGDGVQPGFGDNPAQGLQAGREHGKPRRFTRQ